MPGFVGTWSHALAALLYGGLALWQLRHWNHDSSNRPLAGAFAATAIWCFGVATLGPQSALAGLGESARNFGFLGFMYAILRSAEGDGRRTAVTAIYTVIAGVIGFQLTLAGVSPDFAHNPVVWDALMSTEQILGLTIAAGSLLLVHNLYAQSTVESREAIRLPMIALAAMWIYDLHVNTVAYFTHGPVGDLVAVRGAVMAALVPLFALASRRSSEWRMQMSRAATFQSISVLAILGYLILMMTASRAIEIVGGQWVRAAQIGTISAMTLAALLLLPSARMRAWTRVFLAKHLFEHRYDYREEWLRFTRTIAKAGQDGAELGERVVKAIADIAGSPAGLLLVPDDNGRLALGARWNWRGATPHGSDGDSAFVRFLERTGYIADFPALRGAAIESGGESIVVPSAIASLADAWAGIPLVHGEKLAGLVILACPSVDRRLDWEDFDLFRTAGLQAASYIAEARSQEALADAQRFDEFNRRFAFIMHDIKNLVSQLSLVARNAERHAHNPDFREDMIATLQSSVRKMNDLLARLGRGKGGEAEPPRTINLASIVQAVAETKRRIHPVVVEGDPALAAVADPARLEQALAHLVQNAIDASPAGEPVVLRFARIGIGSTEEARIEVIDRGCGMAPDFVRSRLFHPFSSTKEGGFGVGAYEAKSLVAAMGGRLEVESRQGEGTSFALFFPLGHSRSPFQYERMSA
jgi:putative PEP-CTERM system histidine kinase